MWSSLLKIQYTELKLSCGNDPVVKNYIRNGDLELWPNDPNINRVLPLPQGNHVVKFGKDLIYRTKVIVRKPVWTSTARRPPYPNHIIRPVSRRAYKKWKEKKRKKKRTTSGCACAHPRSSSGYVASDRSTAWIHHKFYFVTTYILLTYHVTILPTNILCDYSSHQ